MIILEEDSIHDEDFYLILFCFSGGRPVNEETNAFVVCVCESGMQSGMRAKHETIQIHTRAGQMKGNEQKQ